MSVAHARSFGELLKHYRLMAGLSQEDLAARAGLSPRGISDLERGARKVPRPSTLTLLAEALGLAPSDRAALLATVRAPNRPADRLPAPSSAVLPRLVGRVHELALLERHLASEGPPLLLLAGEPGIGKSRLLREAATRAQAADWSVLKGGCTRRGGQEPYAPLVEALAGRLRDRPQAQQRRELEGCGWLVRLLPELAETSLVPAPSWTLAPEQERRLMFAAAGRFLANVAGPAGTLLVLDDLQWAGSDALDLLAALVRAAETPLQVVGAYRSTEVHPQDPLAITSADLARDGLVAQTELGPLTRPEAEELLGALLAAGAEQTVVERVVERSGGLPFFLVSCARGLRAGALSGNGLEAVPWDAAQSIRQRVAALPQTAQELLGVAAVVGRVIPGALLLAVKRQSEEEVLGSLEAACEARLLVECGAEVYEFAHDLVREVLERDLSAARRRILHRQVAETMEREAGGYRAETLADHFAQGGQPKRALPYTLQAGAAAEAVFAHAEAERRYKTALELGRAVGDQAREAEAQEKLGNVLTLVMRYDEALEVLDRAVAIARTGGDLERLARAAARIGTAHALGGTPEEGLTRLHALLADLGDQTSPPAPRASLYESVAHLCLLSGRYRECLAAAQQAHELAQAAGDRRLQAKAEWRLGLALESLGRRHEALPAYKASIALMEATGDFLYLGSAVSCLAGLYAEQGDLGEAQQHLERALKFAMQGGRPGSISWVALHLGALAFIQGHWSQARAEYERAAALLGGVPTSWNAAFSLLSLGELDVAEGQRAVGMQALEHVVALGERSHELQPLRAAQQVLAECDLLAGQADAARRRLEPLLDRESAEEPHVTTLLPFLAWSYLELGEAIQAERLAAASRRRATEGEHRLALVDALRIEALGATRQGRWHEAESALEESISLCRAMPYPYAEAKALYVYGQLHAAKGEPEQAREKYQAALAICERLGEGHYRPHIEWALVGLER